MFKPNWLRYLLLISMLLTVCMGSPKGKKVSRYMKWQKHMNRLHGYKCKIPQAQVIRAIDILDRRIKNLDKHYIIPSKTVLHRCISAGCCTFEKQCLPVEMRSVNLWFAVVPKTNKNEKKRKHRYIKVAAANHTQCACQLDINLPK